MERKPGPGEKEAPLRSSPGAGDYRHVVLERVVGQRDGLAEFGGAIERYQRLDHGNPVVERLNGLFAAAKALDEMPVLERVAVDAGLCLDMFVENDINLAAKGEHGQGRSPSAHIFAFSALGSRATLVGALGVALNHLHNPLFGLMALPGDLTLPGVDIVGTADAVTHLERKIL